MFQFASGNAKKIEIQLIQMASAILNEIENERDVEIMLLDTTYEGSEVIDIILDYELIDLFDAPIMDNVINKFWEGQYERDVMFSNQSRVFFIIK